MHENTIITNMTTVTAELNLLEGFTLSADSPTWHQGEAGGPEGCVLTQLQGAWL